MNRRCVAGLVLLGVERGLLAWTSVVRGTISKSHSLGFNVALVRERHRLGTSGLVDHGGGLYGAGPEHHVLVQWCQLMVHLSGMRLWVNVNWYPDASRLQFNGNVEWRWDFLGEEGVSW